MRMATSHDKSSNEAVFPAKAPRGKRERRVLTIGTLFGKLFQSVRKFIVISCDAVRKTSGRFKEACRTWNAKAGYHLCRPCRIHLLLIRYPRGPGWPPFVACENWGAAGLMNILWMHISRHHGITRCRRVPDKTSPLKNGPSYLSHEPLMEPIPVSSRSNVFTFSRVTPEHGGLICI